MASRALQDHHHRRMPSFRGHNLPQVLEHFSQGRVLGITAMPDRSDQRSLGEIFEEIAFEIELSELIEQGYLAPIRVETLPLSINLDGVGLDSRGDIDVAEAGSVVAPCLDALAARIGTERRS